MKTRDLEIAIRTPGSLEQVAQAVSAAFARALELRDNDNFGGDYFRSTFDDGEITEQVVVYRNYDLIDGEPYHADFADFPFILRLEDTARTVEQVTGTLVSSLGGAYAVIEE